MGMFYMNRLTIGMLFGIGIELGIGIDAQPDDDMAMTINNRNNAAILRPLLNFEHSPANLDYAA